MEEMIERRFPLTLESWVFRSLSETPRNSCGRAMRGGDDSDGDGTGFIAEVEGDSIAGEDGGTEEEVSFN